MNDDDRTGPVAVMVNGERRAVPDGTTVAEVICELLGDPIARGVAAALNGAVLPRGRWAHQVLADTDRLEVLTAVQGG